MIFKNILLKFKMVATDQLYNFVDTKTFKVGHYKNFTMNFKMAAKIEVRNNSNFTITLSTI